MDDSDNNSDAEKPSAAKKHDDKQQDENKQQFEGKQDHQYTQQDDDWQNDEVEQYGQDDATNKTTLGLPGSPQSFHTQKRTTSPNSTASSSVRSVLGSGSESGGSNSSNTSEYNRYSVPPTALTVYRGSVQTRGDLPEVPQGSPDHEQMRECVNVAMCILSQTRTRDSMAAYSIGVVDFTKKKYKGSTSEVLKVSKDKMPGTISSWLAILRMQFPNIYISPSCGTDYAQTLREVWGSSLNNYVPRQAAVISLHCEVSSPLSLYLCAPLPPADEILVDFRQNVQARGKDGRIQQDIYPRVAIQGGQPRDGTSTG